MFKRLSSFIGVRSIIRSFCIRGASDIERKAGAHCMTMTPRAAYAHLVFFHNADDNKDNNSILLSTFALSPPPPFSSGRHFLAWRAPFRFSRCTQCATFAPFHLNLMHRGITKRISDLNTGDIMREIKLATPLYHEQVFRINVTPKWIKYFSPALISSQHEREEKH